MPLRSAYIGLASFTILFLYLIGFRAINSTSETPAKHKLILITLLHSWYLFIFSISSTDFFKTYDFPPRFALVLIVPSFIFTALFLYFNKDKNWILDIPEQWLIYFQSFRILVETLFVFSVAKGILHKEVTIEGYNYDMIFAFTAPIIGYLVFYKKLLPKKILLYWNYLGLCVIASIIFLFMTTTYIPHLYGSSIPLLPLESLGYPYVLIAGFLMPVAVFLHCLSILQQIKTPKIIL